MLEDLAEKTLQYAIANGAQYCDVRAESVTSSGFLFENGQVEHSSSRLDRGLGIRVLANGAWGFYSMASPKSMESVRDGVLSAIRGALFYSHAKKKKVILSDCKAHVDTVIQKAAKVPRMEDMVEIAADCDRRIRGQKRIHKSSVLVQTDEFQKYFVNS